MKYNRKNEYLDMLKLLGFDITETQTIIFSELKLTGSENEDFTITSTYLYGYITVSYFIDHTYIQDYSNDYDDSVDISDILQEIEHVISLFTENPLICFKSITGLDSISAAINTKNLLKNLVKVKSSNVYAYGINVRNYGDNVGDIIVQFKGKHGQPDDVYIYYDVPLRVYRRWQSAPSKGHYFWVYIRNIYKYAKLTGDKRGKLKNAVN